MPPIRHTSWIVWLRRSSQLFFLALFLYLFFRTVYLPINRTDPAVQFFFDLDPLAALGTWLATHKFPSWAWPALVVVGVTLLAGRCFCGWVCPLGTLHHLASKFQSASIKERMARSHYSPRQKFKYYLLVMFLAAAAGSVTLFGWLDPLCFLFRSLATAVYPALVSLTVRFNEWLFESDPGVGPLRLTYVTEPPYQFLRNYVLPPGDLSLRFAGSFLIGSLFLLALALNLSRTRFWCRYLCPLGALLGLIGRKPLFALSRQDKLCTDCALCTASCQGGADPHSKAWKPSECVYCMNCQSACPPRAIHIRPAWLSWKVRPIKEKVLAPVHWFTGLFWPASGQNPNLSRRAFLGSALAGGTAALLTQIHPLAQARSFHPNLIRPPGALPEEEFLATCIRCGQCMKVCPTNVIQPAGLEGGLETIWTPVMHMTLGYCEYECTLCMQVCPTQALVNAPVEDKQKIKLGLACIDRSRCLPWAYGRSCIVCEEHCPTPRKAIWFENAEVLTPDGKVLLLKRPHVNPDLCIGCGICEFKCPIKAPPAIRVTSANETRNPKNHVFLS